jgi:cytoskeletal protein RodZ
MGTLGEYLRETREALGIDLRDAAQQTRISINYLKALENQDFARLPGEVFVKGFLKNYSKFLHLDEAEVMKKYGELKPQKTPPGPGASAENTGAVVAADQKTHKQPSLEPFMWGAGILIALILFFFIALPSRYPKKPQHTAVLSQPVQTAPAPSTPKSDKLYLKVVALENTWILIRTDTSPQKKAVLQKGDTLTWSADDRFQLSYGSAGALTLELNGRELIVNEQRNAVIRDLTVTAAGVLTKKNQPEYVKPKRPKQQPEAALPGQSASSSSKPVGQPEPQLPSDESQRTQSPVRKPAASSTVNPAVQDLQQPPDR